MSKCNCLTEGGHNLGVLQSSLLIDDGVPNPLSPGHLVSRLSLRFRGGARW